jgi:hypothetical protein
MPSSVARLMDAAGVAAAGVVRWRESVPLDKPGVYIVALTDSLDAIVTQPRCPTSPQVVQELLNVRPELRLDGARPTRDALANRIASMWLGDETIVYVGKAATSLATRVNQYYQTPVGKRSPHRGGCALKTLSNLDRLSVHFAPCREVEDVERTMLKSFISNVSASARAAVCDPTLPLPFANLEIKEIKGVVRKKHGIKGACEPRRLVPQHGHPPCPTPER